MQNNPKNVTYPKYATIVYKIHTLKNTCPNSLLYYVLSAILLYNDGNKE